MSDKPTNHKEIISLIKKISGQANFIGTPRIYVDIFNGDLVVAVWFNQVVFWDGKNKNPVGFYKTHEEWRHELGLSQFQVRRAAKACERKGLVNILRKKVYGTPKNHYLVVWTELLKILEETLSKSEHEESECSQTEGSETTRSEREESTTSLEGEESADSLIIEEITTESEIYIDGLEISLQEVWERVKENTKDGTPRAAFESHVEPSRVVGFRDGTLIVEVESEDSCDWLAARMKDTAERLLVGVMNREVEVCFIVVAEESVI